MMKICLMASHGYLPSPELVFYQGQTRVIKECPHYYPHWAARHEIKRPNSLSLGPHQHEESWRPMSAFSEHGQHGQLAKIDSTGRPVLIDVQDTYPDSVLFSFGIAEQCTKHEKILKFLTSGSSELDKGGLDLSLLSDLMGPQVLALDVHQQPLIYPSGKSDAPEPLVDFVGDLVRNSKLTVHPDGRVLFTVTGTEMKDILSIVAEFYLSKNSTKLRKQSMLVPQFSWPDISEAKANFITSSLKVKDIAAAPLKSSEKIKLKPSPKKKISKRRGKERDLYKRNYFHACESLLSLMMDKKQHRKTAILSLKKSGPELPVLLTKFSAGIAGTGLAVLFSVIYKVACGRVPLCSSKLFSTGFGFGLVWLSWAVNRLRDTIVYVSKNANKLALKDEEMLRIVGKSLKDIYFRAATLLAVAMLRLA